jgi:colanic acid/amylovoran biosynthesis glycosyltransferase
MMHGADIRTLIETEGSAYKNQFNYVDKFLAISEFSYKILCRYGIPENKIIMHNVGIDTSRLKLIERSGNIKSEIVILSVGRLAEIKGHLYGIEAVSIIRDKLPGYKIIYVIAGDGPEMANLKSRAVELGIGEEVILKGAKNQEELFREYAEADIFLHPSLAEITPLVIMEAFASGLPVVATDVGGVSEIVHHGKNGLLNEKENAVQIAGSLIKLIENPVLRNEFGINGRKYITENYDINILNKKLEQIYLSCLRN